MSLYKHCRNDFGITLINTTCTDLTTQELHTPGKTHQSSRGYVYNFFKAALFITGKSGNSPVTNGTSAVEKSVSCGITKPRITIWKLKRNYIYRHQCDSY